MSVAAGASPVKISPFKIFRNPSFTWMWVGQLVETMGMALTSLASSIMIYRLTNSAMSVGLMLMATAAPSLLVGLFAGVIVDRYDRKKIMIYTSLIRAILVVLIPFLVTKNIAWLYVIVMLSSAIAQFFDPAHESVLPEIAPEEELAAANSLMAISAFGSTAIGFAASGFIASAANISWAFYLNAFTFLFSGFCILLIPIKPNKIEDDTNLKTIMGNLKLGVNQVIKTPILSSLFNSSIPTLIGFGLTNALLLPFALKALKATEFQYGIQEALTSVGFVVASLLIAGVFDRMREGAWIAACTIGMGLTSMAYSFTRSIPLAIIIVMISGFLNAPASVGRRLVVQRNTPREMRGRVNSVFFVARDVLFLIGMAAAGLADYIDIRLMYLVSGIFILSGGLLVLFLPGLRQNRSEWKRVLSLLKTAPAGVGLGIGRPATLADMDSLVGLLPSLGILNEKDKSTFIRDAQVFEVPEGSTILRHGETGETAYFILSGKAIAGLLAESGNYRSLSTMLPGDFFGEIAALTGGSRTADVVAAESTSLLQVSANSLRSLMGNSILSNLFLSKIAERLGRTSLSELPRVGGLDQKDAQDLRTVIAKE